MGPTTTCNICSTTRNETLTEHLADHHMNEMMVMESDPASDTHVIYKAMAMRSTLLGVPEGEQGVRLPVDDEQSHANQHPQTEGDSAADDRFRPMGDEGREQGRTA